MKRSAICPADRSNCKWTLIGRIWYDIMLISVLMSVYNGASTVERAIDSILEQTLTDFELILCDDASTDGTWSILWAYAQRDDRIRLFRNQDNQGLGYSLNRCLEIAQGVYIARQDADDFSAPDRLERTLCYLYTHNLPYAGCGVYVFDDDGVWSRRLFPEVITKHVIAQRNPFFHPTMLFQREVLLGVDGYRAVEITRRAEDYDLVMRLAAQEIIGQNLQEYLYSVYEPPEAYLRHTFRTRWHEVKVRFSGLRLMRAPLSDYIYLLKPIVMCGVPKRLLKTVKRLQWSR